MSVIFDQLRISDDGKRLYINAHVNQAAYFDNVYLDSITILTADKVSETNPSVPTSDYIYTKTFEGETKRVDLVLTATDFTKIWEQDAQAMVFPQSDMSKTLFFVYIKIKGTPDSCVPCGLDEEITLGVTFDENMFYQRVMGYTRELVNDCEIPIDFADYILLWNAFKAAVETEHYIPAIQYWNLLFGTFDSFSTKSKPCGCHG